MERSLRHRWQRLRVLMSGTALVLAMLCACAALSRASSLPDGRAYELVSPPDKHGAGVASESLRTRAAADGSAIGFLSLGAFADARGTGVATEYLSERTGAVGTSGWATHAITPLQSGTSYDGLLNTFEPLYVGELTADLSRGVFFAQSPLTDDPSTANVLNLYLRTDLRSPGAGTYDLITGCPLCDQTRVPLAASSSPTQAPFLAWMSPDATHFAFESPWRLTNDTPPLFNRVEVYESDNGTVTLAGRVPRSGTVCDDVNGPACVGSNLTIAGRGASNNTRTPHVISDGTDGHTRIFFTHPTADGVTPASVNTQAGQLYMRVDGTSTVQLNANERSIPDAFAPARFLDASADGERAFFMTTQALTNDAPTGGATKIYMYDATKPPSAPDKLTYLNLDNEPADTTVNDGQGIVGLSDEGHYVYFVTIGQIVSGRPLLNLQPGLYLWHDGTVSYVGPVVQADDPDLLSSGSNLSVSIPESRVTPDGRWLLYRTSISGSEQFYLYSADNGARPVCVSCDPTGPDSGDATIGVRTDIGGTGTSWHENHALADDGSRVFFNTTQALVPEDVNGREDVYEYDVPSGTVHLLSGGTSPDDSWFLDASTSGSDVFFTTRQQLVGWDRDQEADLYDARVGGGLPDPPPLQPACTGDLCQGALTPPPLTGQPASAPFTGAGNAPGKLKPRVRPCHRGFVHKRIKGRLRCVKKPKKHSKARRAVAPRGHVAHGSGA